MRLRRHTQSEETGDTGIDLAPMLDFVLNLLIFFIITAVFVKELGITVSRPSAKEPPKEQTKKNKSVVIAIRNDGKIWLERREIDVRMVRSNVEKAHAEKPDAAFVVVAEKDAPTGTLVQVLDQVRLGGVENVSIAAGGG
ncbi:MAG TPA: biopolymer transporter ExbD [Candidatus Binatia bacterium]|nr:biopolymer transporter ExbD [Candidatus Binatia bacterium]